MCADEFGPTSLAGLSRRSSQNAVRIESPLVSTARTALHSVSDCCSLMPCCHALCEVLSDHPATPTTDGADQRYRWERWGRAGETMTLMMFSTS